MPNNKNWKEQSIAAILQVYPNATNESINALLVNGAGESSGGAYTREIAQSYDSVISQPQNLKTVNGRLAKWIARGNAKEDYSTLSNKDKLEVLYGSDSNGFKGGYGFIQTTSTGPTKSRLMMSVMKELGLKNETELDAFVNSNSFNSALFGMMTLKAEGFTEEKINKLDTPMKMRSIINPYESDSKKTDLISRGTKSVGVININGKDFYNKIAIDHDTNGMVYDESKARESYKKFQDARANSDLRDSDKPAYDLALAESKSEFLKSTKTSANAQKLHETISDETKVANDKLINETYYPGLDEIKQQRSDAQQELMNINLEKDKIQKNSKKGISDPEYIKLHEQSLGLSLKLGLNSEGKEVKGAGQFNIAENLIKLNGKTEFLRDQNESKVNTIASNLEEIANIDDKIKNGDLSSEQIAVLNARKTGLVKSNNETREAAKTNDIIIEDIDKRASREAVINGIKGADPKLRAEFLTYHKKGSNMSELNSMWEYTKLGLDNVASTIMGITSGSFGGPAGIPKAVGELQIEFKRNSKETDDKIKQETLNIYKEDYKEDLTLSDATTKALSELNVNANHIEGAGVIETGARFYDEDYDKNRIARIRGEQIQSNIDRVAASKKIDNEKVNADGTKPQVGPDGKPIKATDTTLTESQKAMASLTSLDTIDGAVVEDVNPFDAFLNDVISNTASTLTGIYGANLASKDIPEEDRLVISNQFLHHVDQLKKISEMGLTPAEEASIKKDLDDGYSVMMENAVRASGGNRANILATVGTADANRVDGLAKMNALDVQKKMAAMDKYGSALEKMDAAKTQSNRIEDKRAYEQASISKAAGSKLMGDSLGKIIDNIRYQQNEKPLEDLYKARWQKAMGQYSSEAEKTKALAFREMQDRAGKDENYSIEMNKQTFKTQQEALDWHNDYERNNIKLDEPSSLDFLDEEEQGVPIDKYKPLDKITQLAESPTLNLPEEEEQGVPIDKYNKPVQEEEPIVNEAMSDFNEIINNSRGQYDDFENLMKNGK